MKSVEEIAAFLINQRKKLGIEQKDMYMLIGMKQQQYQRIEAGNDIKLSTFLRVLEGLDLELMIAPKSEKKGLFKSNQMVIGKNETDSSKDDLKDDSDDLGFWFNSEENR